MKTYNNFNEMFNSQSGLKSDVSVFNGLVSRYYEIPIWALPYLHDDSYGPDSEGWDPDDDYRVMKWLRSLGFPEVCEPEKWGYNRWTRSPAFGYPSYTAVCRVNQTTDDDQYYIEEIDPEDY